MRITARMASEFTGKIIYAVWDHEENGGFGYFSEKSEAIEIAGGILNDKVYYGFHPYMLVVSQHPSKHVGCFNQIECKVKLGEKPVANENNSNKCQGL